MGHHCAVYYQRIPEDGGSGQEVQRAVAAELLQYAFRDFFGIRLREECILRTPDGKPRYGGALGCFFNISHCASAVAVAVAREPVGVDVEGMRRVKRRTVEKCCSKKEIRYVFGRECAKAERGEDLPEAEAKRFLKLWTLKESRVKMTGEGLRAVLPDVCFDVSGFQESEPGIFIWEERGQYLSCLYTRADGLTMALTLQYPVLGADAGILWIPCASAAVTG